MEDPITAERLGEVICPFIHGSETFPPDHPDLPQLEKFEKKAFEAFVLSELERRFPPVNQVSM